MLRSKALLLICAAALGLAACGGGGGGGGGGGTACTSVKGGTTSGTASQTVKVIADSTTVGAYDPKTVSAKVGDTVEWDWQDPNNQHSVTADDGSFDSGLCGQGGKFFVTFNKAGSIPYHCTIHAQMVGTI